MVSGGRMSQGYGGVQAPAGRLGTREPSAEPESSYSRMTSRTHLSAAIEVARQCGSVALAALAHDELVAAGAPPRRDPIESRSMLSTRELRVCDLAAEGLTNRQIAQALVLTEKTIEVHLTRAY